MTLGRGEDLCEGCREWQTSVEFTLGAWLCERCARVERERTAKEELSRLLRREG